MKSFLLFGSIILGALAPGAHRLGFLIAYLIMAMLFISFSNVRLHYRIVTKNTLWVLVANVAIAFAVYFIVAPFSKEFALTAFIIGLAPTATAAPAVTSFLKGNIEYVTASVVLTNIAIALLLPFFILFVTVTETEIATLGILWNILVVIFVPLLLAQAIRLYLPAFNKTITRAGKHLAFYAWLLVVFIAVGRSSQFIRVHPEIPATTIAITALLALVICIVNFGVGRLIGGKRFGLEASQSLGQKNTMFMLWFSLSFLNPLVALGPVMYLVYHNTYNSYQLFRKDRALQAGDMRNNG